MTATITATVADTVVLERSYHGLIWHIIDIDTAMADLAGYYDDFEVALNDLREGHILCGTSAYSYRIQRHGGAR